MTNAPTPPPAVGTLLRDTRHDRIGEYQAEQGGRLLLRPCGGGREWEVLPQDIEPVDPAEAMHVKLAEANRRSRERGDS